ncbi:MAG TPA: hypothetical protein VE010_22560 [Thermoanaerobaculia bacterium]|nr:hypothetical protein [Thermoanaerobaculia bacterium]
MTTSRISPLQLPIPRPVYGQCRDLQGPRLAIRKHGTTLLRVMLWREDESMTMQPLAERADRSMRTSHARRTTEDTYEALRPSMHNQAALLEALAARRCWARSDETHFVCTFGERTSVLTLPIPFNAQAVMRLVTRAEVNVFLGDSHDVLLPELHRIAQRELERLMERDAPADPRRGSSSSVRA